jgi:peptidylprolyl isomerase
MTEAAGVTVEGGPEEKPRVGLPGGEPPPGLVVHDVREGEGAAAEPGGTVTAHYVGIGWTSGAQFDASWDRGSPLRLPLNRVIAGWQQGIPGMRPGGRRLLVIPAALAYGDRPPPGSGIAPGEALVFVIDLVG